MKKLLALLGLFFCFIEIAAAEEYTFVAAPRGSRADEEALYLPIVNYLAKAGGVKINFVYSDNWLSFRKAVRANSYDFYFNGPHFSSFLATYHGHQFLARLAESHVFVVAVMADERRFQKMSDLVGRSACLHPEPNLGTLLFMSEFPNPARVPAPTTIEGWKQAYDGLVSGKCVATVLPIANFEKFNKDGKSRILHTFKSAPNQAITASARVPEEVIRKMQSALVVAEDGCQLSCKPLLEKYASRKFATAMEQDYFGLSNILREDYVLGKAITDGSKLADFSIGSVTPSIRGAKAMPVGLTRP